MKLCEYLKEKKMSQADFAKKIGVTQGIISYYINGRGMPTRKNMRKIINITGGMVTADDFCFEDSGDGND
nr:MAG TPA: helix-turn-helix domain protein [Caudoviricetes sp.]